MLERTCSDLREWPGDVGDQAQESRNLHPEAVHNSRYLMATRIDKCIPI